MKNGTKENSTINQIEKSPIPNDALNKNDTKIDVVLIERNSIYPQMTFDGKFISGLTWKDKNGINYLILTETDISQSEKISEIHGETRDKEIFAYNFVVDNYHIVKLLWKLYDFMKGCPFDITLKYSLPPVITDLDQDGIYESWLTYLMDCSSDVSPTIMKLIMHEGKAKYEIRGISKYPLGEGFVGDERTFDNNFQNGSREFSVYANRLWNKNKINQ